MKEFWNNRYSDAEYVYGINPNVFFKQQIDLLQPGKLLLPAEGEGRNAVYAATQGWEVTAFDQSEVGKQKAEQLAASQNVSINYLVADVEEVLLDVQQFDAVGLIFAHFPPAIRAKVHRQLLFVLKKGGLVILEGFSKDNLAYRQQNPQIGGPPSLDLLFDEQDILADFSWCKPLLISREVVELSEGNYHVGTGSVIRFTGKK